jgi:hypothetical protein
MLVRERDDDFNHFENWHLTIKNTGDFDRLQAAINGKVLPPYTLEVAYKNRNLDIKISEAVKVALPYVFNYCTIGCVTALERWPIKISYPRLKSVAKINAEATIRKTTSLIYVSSDLTEAAKTAIETLPATFKVVLSNTVANGHRAYAINDDKVMIEIPHALAKYFAIPSRLKSYDMAPKNIIATRPVWLTASFVDEMIMGDVALKLLTPGPIDLYAPIVNMQYVPVTGTRFNEITLNCYSDPTILAPLDCYEDVMVVLHFMPRYKRLRAYADNDTFEFKRFNYG